MEELRKLYDVLVREGKYTKSFEDFQSRWSQDEAYKNKVFDVVSRDGLYSKDRNSFFQKYSVKKKDTGLPSKDGSLVSQKDIEKKPEITLASKDTIQQGVISGSDLIENDKPRMIAQPLKEEDGFGSYLKNAIDVGISTVSKSIYDLPALIYDSAAIFTNPIARMLGVEEASSEKFAETFGLKNIPSEIVGKRIQEKRKEIQEYNDKNGGDALTALENGNILGAAKMVAGTTVESLPLMIPAFMTGGSSVGLGIVGASTASTKSAQLKEENPEMDVASRTLNAVTTGTLEATLGQLLTGASGAVTKRILMNEGSKKGAKIITDSFKSVLENQIEKSPLLPLFGEMLEESLVSVGEQLTDISTGVRTDFDMREVINSGISATGIGGVNTVAIYGAKGYVSAKDYVKLKQINKELSKLSNEVLSSDLSDEEKGLLNSSIERLKSQGKKVVDDAKNKASLLPDEVKKELDNTILSLDGISVAAFKVKSNKNLSDEAKAAMLDELKSQAIELTAKKNEILSKEYNLNEFDKLPDDEKLKLKEDASAILLKEAQDAGQTEINITGDQISKKAFEIYSSKEKAPLTEVEVVRKKKLEDAISGTNESTITIDDSVTSREDAVKELQQLNKKETDAIQKQSTTEIPIQSETTISEEVEGEIPETGPEVVTEQVTQEEVIQPETIVEDTSNEFDVIQSEVDDFNSRNRNNKNNTIDELQNELIKAQDNVFNAQKRISNADDFEVAIQDYNKAKEEVSKIEKQIKDIRDFDKVSSLIFEQVEESKKPNYEYRELFNKDPRLASIQELKELIEFLEDKKNDEDLESINRYKKNIEILEEDIKNNPIRVEVKDNEMSDIEKDLDFYEIKIEDTEEEIKIEKQNTKEEVKRIKEEISKVRKDKSLSRDEKIEKIEDLKSEIEAFKEDQDAIIESYVNDLKDYKSEKKKALKKLENLKSKESVSEVKTKKPKASPSATRNNLFFGVGRILSIPKDVKKITMTEKAALVKQIRDKARGAKDAIKANKEILEEIRKDVKELASSGKITAKQVSSVVKAFSRVNVFSQKSVNGFINYMTRVFENAEYANKLNKAKGLKKSIKKVSKNKEKNANLRSIGLEFSKIDPSLVEDIDAYNNMAEIIKKAIKGSTLRMNKLNFVDTININDFSEYVKSELESQNEKIKEQTAAEIQDLMGVDASELSYDEMISLLNSEKEIEERDEDTIRRTIKEAFKLYSKSIQESISINDYTKSQKQVVSEFMKMDTDKMDIRDSIEAVDALNNFLVNQSTAKMQSVVSKYKGEQNAKKLKDDGIFAVALSKLGSKRFGRFLGEQTTNLNILFEKMFVGFNRGQKVMDAMGLTDVINGKAKAKAKADTMVAEYITEFYKKEPNGQKFNTAFNDVERDMLAYVMRSPIGTESDIQKSFDTRKRFIEESIEVLSKGNSEEVSKSELYQKVYDKILKDSKNSDEVLSKVDKINADAVDFWINKWSENFEELSDVALNVYNKVLDRDLNYTPDKVSKTKFDSEPIELLNTESSFIVNTDGSLYKKEAGTLMEKTVKDKLPKDAYIDLSFDKNNSNSMYNALVDINTASAIRQVESFMSTDDFKKIFKEDADLIKGAGNNPGRVQTYIRNIRNKNAYQNDEFSKLINDLNKIATIGVGQALAGPLQPIKQVVPVVMNTLVNTKGNLDLGAMKDKEFMVWLKDLGYAISSRGAESLADIESVNKLIDKAAESKGAKAIKFIEESNKKYLKTLLVKPDVFIAVCSWKSYYEQSLREQGENTENIDYSKHELNKKAADYAQGMVDRQQNISDTDLAGTLFTRRDPFAQTMVKIFLPFASFRMNQASRLGSDLRVLSNKDVATEEDRKIAIRSLSGYAVETATFRIVSAGIGVGLSMLASAVIGSEEEEEDKEKRRNNILKGAATSTLVDIVSPIPVLDNLVQNGASSVIENIQRGLDIDDEDIINIYSAKEKTFAESLGTFGIALKRVNELWDIILLSATGEYKDRFGRTITIPNENREALMKIAPVVLVSNLTGLASPEISSVGRNAVKIAKKIPKKTSIEFLKKVNPELYNRIKNTSSQKAEDALKERLKEVKDRIKNR